MFKKIRRKAQFDKDTTTWKMQGELQRFEGRLFVGYLFLSHVYIHQYKSSCNFSRPRYYKLPNEEPSQGAIIQDF
jgi:hypothetical protein